MPKMVKDDEIFVPEPPKGEWTPVPLTIKRSLQLARLLSWVVLEASFSLPASRAEVNAATLMPLLDVLDEEKLTRLFGVILDKPDEWVARNWILSKALSCLVAFWEAEDLGEVLKTARLMSTTDGSVNSSTFAVPSTAGASSTP